VEEAQLEQTERTDWTGNPAVVELMLIRPVTLRPHLSMGLPFSA
jgi:hypothetical protein